MSNTWGENMKISIFGESHGNGIGVVIDGILPGLKIDQDYVAAQMARRAPGQVLSTPRREPDQIEWISGVVGGVTCGTPICVMIRNTNTRSGDYTPEILRPSHADYTAHIKYNGFEDYRGGGHFSGRITAGLVAAGALCGQILRERMGIAIGSHITRLHTYIEEKFPMMPEADLLQHLQKSSIPCLNPDGPDEIRAIIEAAVRDKNSVGGVVETMVTGLPAGLGDPFFDSIESKMAHLLFSVPAVKGVSFGAGFAIAGMTGAQVNDAFCMRDGKVCTRTNYSGGIQGGITNGMPLVFETAIKPTPSIGSMQHTVDLSVGENTVTEIKGRHDPCIVLRAIPVLEAVAMIGLYDAWKGSEFRA